MVHSLVCYELAASKDQGLEAEAHSHADHQGVVDFFTGIEWYVEGS